MNRACLSAEEFTSCVETAPEAIDLEAMFEHIEGCAACAERFRATCESVDRANSEVETISRLDRELLGRIQSNRPVESAAFASPRDPVIPGFEIEQLIGEGGQAVVYRARQVRIDGRVVALKVLGVSNRAMLRAQVVRFQNEAMAYSRLEHPNIVRLYDVAESDGFSYLVLEYVEGETLRERLDRQRFTFAQAAEFLELLANATQFAHERGIIHRDLKPRNILLTKDGVPKISDFGLARLLESDSDVTFSQQPLGTKEYMSPEQALGHGSKVGPEADVYSLGTILYEILVGRPPFVGNDWSDLIAQIRDDDPVSIGSLRPGLPRDLETICFKCLRKQPQDRYHSAKELAEDLRAFLERRPLHARPPGAVERAFKFARRNRSAVAVVSALLVGMLGTSSFAAWAFDSQRRVIKSEHDRRTQLARSKIENGSYHASRGEWNRAIEVLNDAARLDEGSPGDAYLMLAQIDSHLSNFESARKHLALAQHWLKNSPAVSLTEATLLESSSPERSRLLAQQALDSGKLTGADREYASALTSPTLQDTLNHLKATLDEQPFHLSAARHYAGLLMLCGRFDEAREQAVGIRHFYPKDRTFVVIEAIQHAAHGDLDQAKVALDKAADQLSPEVLKGVTTLMEALGNLNRRDLDFDNLPLDSTIGIARDLIRAYLQVAAVRTEHGISPTLPPGLQDAYQKLPASALNAGGGGILARMLGQKASASLPPRLVEVHRDAFTLHVLGRALAMEGKYDRASRVFEEATKSQSLIDMRRANHFLASRCEFQRFRFEVRSPEDKSTLRGLLQRNITALLDLQETAPTRLFYCGQMAWQMGDNELLIRVANHWRKLQPKSAGPDLYAAYYHYRLEQFLAAYDFLLAAANKEIPAEFALENMDITKEIAVVQSLCRDQLAKRGMEVAPREPADKEPAKPE